MDEDDDDVDEEITRLPALVRLPTVVLGVTLERLVNDDDCVDIELVVLLGPLVVLSVLVAAEVLAPAPTEPVSDKLAPIRVSAIMAVTAFCQRRLTTYFLSLVLLNLVVVPFLTGVLANHL